MDAQGRQRCVQEYFPHHLAATTIIISVLCDSQLYDHKIKSQDNFESIIGTVDSEPITTYDLSQKIKIMLNSMGLVDSIENRDSLRSRAVELIIEEKVKLIESKKQQRKTVGENYVLGCLKMA